MRKYSREYWIEWRRIETAGYHDGYNQFVWNPPKKYDMFYEAYSIGYTNGSFDQREGHDELV